MNQSKKNSLSRQDIQRWLKNMLVFVAPTLVIFFSLLAQGVSLSKAWPVAAFAFYQSLADLFKKYKSGK